MSREQEFMERIKTRMSKSLSQRQTDGRKKVQKTFQNIAHTRFDRAVWDEMRQHPRVSEHIVDLYAGNEEDGRKPYDLAGELIQDVAYQLYKTSPRYERKRNVHKSALLNRAIEEMIEELPAFNDLHEKTAMDPVVSLMATEALMEPIYDLIRELSQEPPEPPEGEPGEGEGDEAGAGGGGSGKSPIDKANEQYAKDKALPEDQDHEGEERPDDLIDAEDREWNEDLELDEESQFELDRIMEEIERKGLDRDLNRAAQSIEERLDKLERSRKDVGVDDGVWATMSPEERMDLADRLNTREMQALADMVGKMRRFALGVKATKVIDAPEEIYDVTMGNDMRHLLRSEYALLATKDTSYEFYRKFYDRELLQFALRGKEDVGKGPIVVAIDKSGSMSGTPFHWSMAVAEALRRFCQEDGRDYYAMFFGNNNDRERFFFPQGEPDPDLGEGYKQVLNFLSCQANGGTQFDGVLNEAVERCRQQFEENGEHKADIVFITDGYAHLDDEWINTFNEEREKIECRVFSVFVGGAYDMGHYSGEKEGPVHLLKRLSDVVIPVSELTGSSAEKIFANI